MATIHVHAINALQVEASLPLQHHICNITLQHASLHPSQRLSDTALLLAKLPKHTAYCRDAWPIPLCILHVCSSKCRATMHVDACMMLAILAYMVWWAWTSTTQRTHCMASDVTSGHSCIRCAMSSTLMMFAISISTTLQHGVVGMHVNNPKH
jgi:hypothetical protein